MKKNPKIVCACKGKHICGLLGYVASSNPPQDPDTVENMSIDSNSSAATNAGNETIPAVSLTNEDSGIDTLNFLNVPAGTSALSSGNTSPDMDTLTVPSATASLSNVTTPDTETSISSGVGSANMSSTEQQPTDAKVETENAGDGSTRMSLAVPPSGASNPGSPTHQAGTSKDDPSPKTSPSRPSSFTSGLRRSYHEFSKASTDDDAFPADEGIIKTIPYDKSEEMATKKKKSDEEPLLRGKSTSSSGGSRSRTSSTSQSVESRDTSTENLSGYSGDNRDDNDWYTRMRTRGPKINVTGNVLADGTIDETEERRSSSEGGLLSTNPPPGGDVCQDIYFGRQSPSLGGDEEPPKQDDDPQSEGPEDDKED